MRGRLIKLAGTLAALAALAVGGSTLASAAHQGPSHATKPAKVTRQHAAQQKAAEPSESATESESAGDSETAADQAKQDAACTAAGVSGDNVNYDDATGTCTADTGGGSANG